MHKQSLRGLWHLDVINYSALRDFTVDRVGYSKVTFLVPVDPLHSLLSPPSSAPLSSSPTASAPFTLTRPQGEGLNVHSRITLLQPHLRLSTQLRTSNLPSNLAHLAPAQSTTNFLPYILLLRAMQTHDLLPGSSGPQPRLGESRIWGTPSSYGYGCRQPCRAVIQSWDDRLCRFALLQLED